MPNKRFQIVVDDFSGGTNSIDNPLSLKTNEFTAETKNFDIVGRGFIQKRYGFDVVSSGGSGGIRGLLPFYKSDGTKQLLIFSANGKLYTITPSSNSWVDRGTAFTDNGSRVNGDIFNDLAIFGNGNSAVKKWTGSTLADLGGTPPQGNIFRSASHVFFISGVAASPSVLYWSDKDNPEVWSGGISGFTPIAIGNGQRIKNISIHSDQITVFKDKEKYGLQETFDENSATAGFAVKEVVDSSDGAVSGNSVQSTWNGLIFLGRRGFQKYGQAEGYPDRRVPESLSFLVSSRDPTSPKITFKDINLQYADKATSLFWGNKYYCAAPTNKSTLNNAVFVINKTFPNNPFVIWDGMNISDFCIFEDGNGIEEVYFSSETEGTIYKMNQKFIDSYDETSGGAAIEAIYRTKTFVPSNKNIFRRIFIEGAMTKPCIIDLKVFVGSESGFFSETFQITDTFIHWFPTSFGVIGDTVVGQTTIGGEVGSNPDAPMFSFFAEISLPENVNTGRQIYLQIESANIGEGIRIDNIVIEGEYEDSSVVLVK